MVFDNFRQVFLRRFFFWPDGRTHRLFLGHSAIALLRTTEKNLAEFRSSKAEAWNWFKIELLVQNRFPLVGTVDTSLNPWIRTPS